MLLKHLTLENFRSHKKSSFDFSKTTVIIGRNTAGKTNILEAIYFLSSGKSFRADKDADTISLRDNFAKITGLVEKDGEKINLSVLLSIQNTSFSKKFKVNNVAKRQTDFVQYFYSVLFTPEDLDIILGSPNLRRKFIDNILYKADRKYRLASSIYEKSLRQRNRMLSNIKDGSKYYKAQDFLYWDNLLIENGQVITDKRNEFIEFVNASAKEIFNFSAFYDRSTVTQERFQKYYDAERAAGITLIGPQRDEFMFLFPDSDRMIREYGSRGEQRLTLLQLKLFEIKYLEGETNEIPVLLLDDIFSELDSANIEKVFALVPTQQTIITTTHKEFVPKKLLTIGNLNVIEL